jgi:4-amino-4-deoxy-L-arabinose transferase-like glycosyltransferase
MTSSTPSNTSIPAWVGPFFALLFATWATFVHLGDFSLLSPDEGRNAEVAREMKVSGSWLVPTYDGATYLDKPAFFFKASALALKAFGDTEWAARLPSALSAWLWLMLLFAFCRRAYGPTTASLAVVVLALTPLFEAFARIVIFDMMLGLFVSSAILAAYRAGEAAEYGVWGRGGSQNPQICIVYIDKPYQTKPYTSTAFLRLRFWLGELHN